MDHALKGTGYSLDIDATKMGVIEELLNEGLKDYVFNPVVTSADARVVGFPMPGGAIGPNVHMMVKAGILDKYSKVLEEFPVVVKAGGGWTSVTPGSQQYWLQAFNNVLYGRWEKIEPGYGKSVLGYFGKTPLPSDPAVVEKASAQLKLPVLTGDPLSVAPDILPEAKAELAKRGLPTDEKSIFLVAAAMVPGKNIELNEGLRLLKGNPKIELPLKKKEASVVKTSVPKAVVSAPPPAPVPVFRPGPVTSNCVVEENGVKRNFRITIDIPNEAMVTTPRVAPVIAAPAASPTGNIVPVYSPFDGDSPVVELGVNKGDQVTKGQTIGAVEAMKTNHAVIVPVSGEVCEVHVGIGDDVDLSKPIISILTKE
ncbi:biotin attachment protein [bacterium]|nr:biotin attachment protein [bacterium]